MEPSEETPAPKVNTLQKERVKMARAKHEETQRMKLHELQEQAAAAQMQREKIDEDRRQRHRLKEEERRQQVEERKRALWEASMSRREAMIQRDKERQEKIERAKQSRCQLREGQMKFAFGSSTPRSYNLDMMSYNWAARRAASTINVMAASTSQPGASSSAIVMKTDYDKDENDKSRMMPSSVGRRRTDLLPTVPSRHPGRAYSMTRLDKIPHQRPLHSASPSMHHLNRTQWRSGDTSPTSRPGSALSITPTIRRSTSARQPRPISIAGTGVNTPKVGYDSGSTTAAATPVVSRDNTLMASAHENVRRRPAPAVPRKPRPLSAHTIKTVPTTNNSNNAVVDHKPPIQKREKMIHPTSLPVTPRTKSSPTCCPSPYQNPPSRRQGDYTTPVQHAKSHVNPVEVTQKLEKLQKTRNDVSEAANSHTKEKTSQVKETKKPTEPTIDAGGDIPKPPENKSQTREGSPEKKEQKPVEKKEEREISPEKKEEEVMTTSMSARRITTEEEAKAALAERRRKAREELERQAELEKQRLKEEEEAEARRQQEEEARLRKEEEEALQLARLQRQVEEEKLKKAIEAQQKAEREEAERLAREEKERQARLREEEEKKKAAEEAERIRREESEKEEKERLARKQRVEAIMARTRLKKQAIQAEEEKKQQELNMSKSAQTLQTDTKDMAVEVHNDPATLSPASAQTDNGNISSGDLLNFETSQSDFTSEAPESGKAAYISPTANVAPSDNGNLQHSTNTITVTKQNNTDQPNQDQIIPNKQVDISPNANTNNAPVPMSNNGNLMDSNLGHMSADFIQTERLSSEHNKDMPKLIDDDFPAHNGHGTAHDNTLLTLQN